MLYTHAIWQKKDENGNTIDFDKIYHDYIKPSIVDAGLEPVRADEEQTGGIIHKAMYERLMLCEYAVADLSLLNANVFYELGVCHAIRPHSTVTLFENGSRLPFDVSFLRSIPYDRELSNLAELKETLTQKLINVQSKEKDIGSPLFQLVDGIKPSNIEHIKTDIFREQVQYNQQLKAKLEKLRREKDLKGLLSLEDKLNFQSIEFGVLVDLFLSYRAVEAFENMVFLVEKMPKPLQQSVMIQEQLGFALNRIKQREKALHVLETLVKERGKNSETCGILGRVYKDYWQENQSNVTLAKGYLKKAIQTYLDGFESDFRDAYPGINAVTLMDIAGDKRKNELLPIVTYAVKQKMKTSTDYWDYATLLELAILENNKEKAEELIADVLVHVREPFEPKTTANNIQFIREHREIKGIDCNWIKKIELILTRNT